MHDVQLPLQKILFNHGWHIDSLVCHIWRRLFARSCATKRWIRTDFHIKRWQTPSSAATPYQRWTIPKCVSQQMNCSYWLQQIGPCDSVQNSMKMSKSKFTVPGNDCVRVPWCRPHGRDSVEAAGAVRARTIPGRKREIFTETGQIDAILGRKTAVRGRNLFAEHFVLDCGGVGAAFQLCGAERWTNANGYENGPVPVLTWFLAGADTTMNEAKMT